MFKTDFLRRKAHESCVIFACKKSIFILIALVTIWLLLPVQYSEFGYSSDFTVDSDQILIEEIEKFDLNNINQPCHMRITSKRLNNLLNLLSQKEHVFGYQLDKLKVLSFNSHNSSRNMEKELSSYVNIGDPNTIRVNSHFLRMLYAKSLHFSFSQDRNFKLIELEKVRAQN